MKNAVKILVGIVAIGFTLGAFLDCSGAGSGPGMPQSQSSATSDSKYTFVFATELQFNGNLGGRAGADQKCKDALAIYQGRHQPLNCSSSNVRALIGIGPADRIVDMQSHFAIPNYPFANVTTLPDGTYRIDPSYLGLNFGWDKNVTYGALILPNTYFHFENPSQYWMGATGHNATSGDHLSETCNGFTYGNARIDPPGGCTDPDDLRCANALVCDDYNSCSLVKGSTWSYSCDHTAQLMCACW